MNKTILEKKTDQRNDNPASKDQPKQSTSLVNTRRKKEQEQPFTKLPPPYNSSFSVKIELFCQ